MMTAARIGSISSGLDAAKPIDDLEDAEGHGVGADREQVRHAADHQRGERAEQHPDREGAEHRQAEDPGPQEDGDEGEQRGDRPDERLQPLDRHAEQRRRARRCRRWPGSRRRRCSAAGTTPGRSSASGATIIAIRSLALKTTVPIENSRWNGAASRWPSSGKSTPHSRGSRIAIAVSSCDRPSDATVSSSRGALKNRRMTASSTIAPTSERGEDPGRHGEPVGPAPRGHQHHDQHDGDRRPCRPGRS